MSTLGGHMAFVLFVGAARADATPEQATLLRERVVPLLDGFREGGDPRPVLQSVIDVMGPQWRPDGEWAAWIDGMLTSAPKDPS